MSGKKTDKNEINKKKILNAVVQILDQRTLFKDESASDADKALLAGKQAELLDTVRKTVSLSNIKGKGGVISSMGEYKFILEALSESFGNADEKKSEIFEALDVQAYRLQNKLCERLFPEEATYIDKRIKRLDDVWKMFGDQLEKRFKESGLKDKLDGCANIFIFEEDEESMLTKSLIEKAGISGFAGFVAHNDAFKLKGDKVISFEEAGIKEDDALIFCASKYLRKFDIDYSKSKITCNIIEFNPTESE